MSRGARIAALLAVAVMAGFAVQRIRVQVPPDPGFTTGLPERVGNLDLSVGDYTLTLRRDGDDWVFVRGAKGRVRDARVQEFLAPLRTLHGEDIANVGEEGLRDEEIALGRRRFEIRIDAEDLDRRLIGIEVGAEVIDGHRAVRQQGRLSAFWADIWTDIEPLPFADARWWLEPDQPVLCLDDPAVLQVSRGRDSVVLSREPSAAGVAWWIGDVGTGQLVEERHRDLVEQTAWSLTEVKRATTLSPPFDPDVEAALAVPDITIRYTPEKAAVQSVAIGTLRSGEVVARSDAITLLVPAPWRDSLARLLDLSEPPPTSPPPAPPAGDR